MDHTQKLLAVRPVMFRNHPGAFLALATALGFGAYFVLTSQYVAIGYLLLAFSSLSYLRWWLRLLTTRLEVNADYVIKYEGLIALSSVQMRHSKIQNTYVRQSAFQRIMGVGDVGFSSAGEGAVELVVAGIVAPRQVKRQIDQLIDPQARTKDASARSDASTNTPVEHHATSNRPALLASAKRTKLSDYGPLSTESSALKKQSTTVSTPRGVFVGFSDGTVVHAETGLEFIRAPWGMTWDGKRFIGDPIKIDWGDATKLFGRGKSASAVGSTLTGESLQKSDYENGFKNGKCSVIFAGSDDWRLPTALELDLLAMSMECDDKTNYPSYEKDRITPTKWKGWNSLHGTGENSAMARKLLFPEWSTLLHAWSATANAGGIAWALDDHWPLGDFETRSKSFSVMLVRKGSPIYANQLSKCTHWTEIEKSSVIDAG